jgi:hypothetical protein
MGGALASGQQGVQAISWWVAEHAEELCALLRPPRRRLPSDLTLRRALRALDLAALERRVGRFVAGRAAPPHAGAVGMTVDGKAVRGSSAHGAAVHLVSPVRHRDGCVLGQVAVDAKRNEITAVPRLLARRDLAGAVVTMDALLTRPALAQQIRQQGGHDLPAGKENQPPLDAAIDQAYSSELIVGPAA